VPDDPQRTDELPDTVADEPFGEPVLDSPSTPADAAVQPPDESSGEGSDDQARPEPSESSAADDTDADHVDTDEADEAHKTDEADTTVAASADPAQGTHEVADAAPQDAEPVVDASVPVLDTGAPERVVGDTLVGPDDTQDAGSGTEDVSAGAAPATAPDEPADGPARVEPAAHDTSAQGTEPASKLPPGPERTGWRALGHAMAPRATRAQLVAGVLCALLGFAVVVQVRQNDETALSGLRQSELVRILDETTERSDELRREVTELRTERDALDSGSDGQAAALDSLRRSAIMQGILSGRLPAEGPGIQVTLIDPAGDLQPVTMLNLLEELRNAGAEAIQLGGQRITASSSFTGTKGHVLVDGVPLHTPYVWLAIGDPSTLSIALQIPGGAMATVRGTGATGTVVEQDRVQVTATRELPDPRYATPQDEG